MIHSYRVATTTTMVDDFAYSVYCEKRCGIFIVVVIFWVRNACDEAVDALASSLLATKTVDKRRRWHLTGRLQLSNRRSWHLPGHQQIWCPWSWHLRVRQQLCRRLLGYYDQGCSQSVNSFIVTDWLLPRLYPGHLLSPHRCVFFDGSVRLSSCGGCDIAASSSTVVSPVSLD
jgi:hypothetical protein